MNNIPSKFLPKKAEDFPAQQLIQLADKLIKAGIEPSVLQDFAVSANTLENKILTRRIVTALKNHNPILLFTSYEKQYELLYDYYFAASDRMAKEAQVPGIKVPKILPGEVPIIIGTNVLFRHAIAACRQLFVVNTYGYRVDELGKSLIDVRRSNSGYCVITKNYLNASENKDCGGKPAVELMENGHLGMTLLERLVLELFVFVTTGKHLDAEKYCRTICTGSYFEGRGYPTVQWTGDNLEIACIAPDVYIQENKDFYREVRM